VGTVDGAARLDVVGTVDGGARLEVVEVALLASVELSQRNAQLFTNADANLYCLVCFLRKC
jgi:hypothetical protein